MITKPLQSLRFNTLYIALSYGIHPIVSDNFYYWYFLSQKYHINPGDRDQIRRTFLQKGACQPFNHDFPWKELGKTMRCFNPAWFKEHKWLEYSILKDVAYCLYCDLFKWDIENQVRGDAFVIEGFSNWKRKRRLKVMWGLTIVHIIKFGKNVKLC